mgnify:CR=1 FL=1
MDCRFVRMNCFFPPSLLALVLSALLNSAFAQSDYLPLETGEIHFISEAPQETIQAKSTEIEGLLDPASGFFAISLPIISFDGFNNALQQVHFNENYMESVIYPKSTFEGKIIEDISFEVPGSYEIRAKGTLSIHGAKTERIINCQLIVNAESVQVKSTFFVPLIDHDISIPKVVKQKISPEIKVNVDLSFETP